MSKFPFQEPEKIKLSSMNFIHETLFSSVCLVSLLFIETTGFTPVSNPLGTWVISLEVQHKAYHSLPYSTKIWNVCGAVPLQPSMISSHIACRKGNFTFTFNFKISDFSVKVRLFLCLS
jgi:hypothetical protein